MDKFKFKANRFGTVFDVLEWDFTGHPDRQNLLLGLNGKECLRESIKNLDLMQYIGLKDKNDIEIYEGYLVKGTKYPVGLILYENYKYVIELPKVLSQEGLIYDQHDQSFKDSQIEVIGNIYENPELFKMHIEG